jgi:hypothetical protein
MNNNDDILNVLEEQWGRVDEIAHLSHVHVVRWRVPESRRHWARSIATALAIASAAAVLLIAFVPQPDGLYVSNLSNRSKALMSLNQTGSSVL